jgi:hypothetical protein
MKLSNYIRIHGTGSLKPITSHGGVVLNGLELLERISQSTDLPDHLILDELQELLKAAQISESNVTLDQLREILTNYLQDVLIELKEDVS